MLYATVNPQAKVFAQEGAPSLPLLHQELVECDQKRLHARPWIMLHRASLPSIWITDAQDTPGSQRL